MEGVNVLLRERNGVHRGVVSVSRTAGLQFVETLTRGASTSSVATTEEAATGAVLRVPAHTLTRLISLDGERLLLVGYTSKCYAFTFESSSSKSRVEDALRALVALPPPPAAPLKQPSTSPGWNLYNHAEEYFRVFGRSLGTSKSPYRITSINAQYDVCSTYPFLIVVPAGITDAQIAACARFRSRGRFTAITWRHPVTGATLSRAAQPLVGLSLGGSVRCEADETMLAAVRQSCNASVLQIVDCRPLLNAHANKMTGGGSTNLSFYPACRLEQLDMPNVHKVRDSFEALQSACIAALRVEWQLPIDGSAAVDDAHFWGSVDQSRWLQNVMMVLKGALRIASLMAPQEEGGSAVPVLVHCSDGWDRTPQVCSLAQIILDPHCRTRRGFAALICKEWISFGHQFALRTFAVPDKKEQGPIFLQWIDCVWQICRRFPTAFEFNNKFLLALVDHLYERDTGTLSCDCERQSLEQFVPHRFESLWGLLLSGDELEVKRYGNSTYKPTSAALWFRPTSASIKLFESLFLRSFVQ